MQLTTIHSMADHETNEVHVRLHMGTGHSGGSIEWITKEKVNDGNVAWRDQVSRLWALADPGELLPEVWAQMEATDEIRVKTRLSRNSKYGV